jgi:hypothetical protein
MSDSEIKEFGLARLKEDDAGLGSIVLVTKLPSDAAMLASIDLGSIERLRTLRVSLEKLEAWPGIYLENAEAEKQGWITDLERRCKDEYAEIYTVGTNLEYKAAEAKPGSKSAAAVQRNYKDALGGRWGEGDPIRLISDGMVNSEEKPGYIGFVKTKIQLPGYLWGTYEPKIFMNLPPESLQVVPSQESQEPVAEYTPPQATRAGLFSRDLNAPLIPKGGGRKRKRKTKRRRTKRKTKQKRTKKRGTKRR